MNISAWILTGLLGWGLMAQTQASQPTAKTDSKKKVETTKKGDTKKSDKKKSGTEKEGPDAGTVVDEIQKFYENTEDYEATFNQIYKNKLMNETKKSSGKVYIKRPGKMRWEYKKPTTKLFVSDGKTLWVYEKEANQVYKQDLADSELPTAITFLMGKGNLKKDFDYKIVENEKAADKGLLVLELVPKKATTQYKKLLFMVDAGTYQVERTIIIDASGNTNSMRFSKVKTNKGVKNSKFNFKMPKGATLVD